MVQEVIHTMHKQKSRKGIMMLKLDLDKAYDMLNWDFFRDTLFAVGLPSSLVDLIMFCTESNSL